MEKQGACAQSRLGCGGAAYSALRGLQAWVQFRVGAVAAQRGAAVCSSARVVGQCGAVEAPCGGPRCRQRFMRAGLPRRRGDGLLRGRALRSPPKWRGRSARALRRLPAVRRVPACNPHRAGAAPGPGGCPSGPAASPAGPAWAVSCEAVV